LHLSSSSGVAGGHCGCQRGWHGGQLVWRGYRAGSKNRARAWRGGLRTCWTWMWRSQTQRGGFRDEAPIAAASGRAMAWRSRGLPAWRSLGEPGRTGAPTWRSRGASMEELGADAVGGGRPGRWWATDYGRRRISRHVRWLDQTGQRRTGGRRQCRVERWRGHCEWVGRGAEARSCRALRPLTSARPSRQKLRNFCQFFNRPMEVSLASESSQVSCSDMLRSGIATNNWVVPPIKTRGKRKCRCLLLHYPRIFCFFGFITFYPF
jgi:hypothetical protein